MIRKIETHKDEATVTKKAAYDINRAIESYAYEEDNLCPIWEDLHDLTGKFGSDIQVSQDNYSQVTDAALNIKAAGTLLAQAYIQLCMARNKLRQLEQDTAKAQNSSAAKAKKK